MKTPSRSAASKLELLGMKIPKAFGFVPSQLKLPNTVNEQRAFLMHNPKAAGTSLKEALGAPDKRTLHIWASGAFRRTVWETSVVICAVRDPVERFLSGYRYHVQGSYKGYLYKQHGVALKSADLQSYFDCIKQYPDYLGQQSLWYSYPSTSKPICDVLLRLEESEGWKEQLLAAGLRLSLDSIPRNNRSLKPDVRIDIPKSLLINLTDYYAEDYDKLNYAKPLSF